MSAVQCVRAINPELAIPSGAYARLKAINPELAIPSGGRISEVETAPFNVVLATMQV